MHIVKLDYIIARLLVLWLLSERELTGYDIKKALTDPGMSFWFGLKPGSIYSVLKTLTKGGHAEVMGTEKPGNRPARTRYKITAEGRELYKTLLREALATPTPSIGPVDVALAARGDLSAAAVRQGLMARSAALRELRSAIEQNRPAAPSSALVDRNLAIVGAELAWLEQLDETLII